MFCTAACILAATVTVAPGGKVAILDIENTGLDKDVVKLLSEVLSAEVQRSGKFDEVMSGADIKTMLSFESQQQALGCTDDSCMAEIGGALGVDRIIASNIGRLSDTYVVHIKLIHIAEARAEDRVYETVKGEVDVLLETVKRAVASLRVGNDEPVPQPTPAPPALEAAPPPPPPSAGIGVVPIALWSVGLAGIGAGIALGVVTENHRERAVPESQPGAQIEAQKARDFQIGANIAYGVGIVAAAVGLLAFFLDWGVDPGVAVAAGGEGATALMGGRF